MPLLGSSVELVSLVPVLRYYQESSLMEKQKNGLAQRGWRRTLEEARVPDLDHLHSSIVLASG